MKNIVNVWTRIKKNQFDDTWYFWITWVPRTRVCSHIIRGFGRIVVMFFRITTRTCTKIQTWWNKTTILVRCSIVKVSDAPTESWAICSTITAIILVAKMEVIPIRMYTKTIIRYQSVTFWMKKNIFVQYSCGTCFSKIIGSFGIKINEWNLPVDSSAMIFLITNINKHTQRSLGAMVQFIFINRYFQLL